MAFHFKKSFSEKELKRLAPIQKSVLDLESHYAEMSSEDLQKQTDILKKRLETESLDDILPDAFAVCREAAFRVLGMKHFPVQVMGGIVLHKGMIAEMQTGEGKTLVATLPVYLNALTGKGVHVVTVNSYLAKRDSEWMGRLYRWLGLSVGLIYQELKGDERKKAYNADITYGTNNEFGFDYLRDNMTTATSDRVQRSHAYAIVDEVDSILIDEARTPLIISGGKAVTSPLYQKADAFVRSLKKSVILELDGKVLTEDQVDGDYVVDEKQRSCTLTQTGALKAEKYFQLGNLSDLENGTIKHHIEKAAQAHGLMTKDIDYVLTDGKVVIVDSFTGRLMDGRRFNDGLHQAIEAKEGVTIEGENQTLATITFQNYFRLYSKLSGMTGTATTEKDEFREIYGLNIVCVPTNKPCVRVDHQDIVLRSEKAKFHAIAKKIVASHEKGQPVLIGTVNVEKSEAFAEVLRQYVQDFNILNAKFHEQEAAIVAQAGKKGAITIATNMAGRGTDISLGGNPEFLAMEEIKNEGFALELLCEKHKKEAEEANANLSEKATPVEVQPVTQEEVDELHSEAVGHSETNDPYIKAIRLRFESFYKKHKEETDKEAAEVREAGGLFVIGTERHESRRIDNQLRGRAGRQSDPGESLFLLCPEDDLMRLFGGSAFDKAVDTLNVQEDDELSADVLTKAIQSAQQKKEKENFAMRKNVLSYDDVMNQQRTTIYAQRQEVLNAPKVEETIFRVVTNGIQTTCDAMLVGNDPKTWNVEQLNAFYLEARLFNEEDTEELYIFIQQKGVTSGKVAEFLFNAFKSKYDDLFKYSNDEQKNTVLRRILILTVDTLWIKHINDMDQLRKSVALLRYAQRDPVIEYRVEGFLMYDEMLRNIQHELLKRILNVKSSK